MECNKYEKWYRCICFIIKTEVANLFDYLPTMFGFQNI